MILNVRKTREVCDLVYSRCRFINKHTDCLWTIQPFDDTMGFNRIDVSRTVRVLNESQVVHAGAGAVSGVGEGCNAANFELGPRHEIGRVV